MWNPKEAKDEVCELAGRVQIGPLAFGLAINKGQPLSKHGFARAAFCFGLLAAAEGSVGAPLKQPV